MWEFINNNLTNIISLFSLFLSIVALVISSIIVTKGWWRQRNIYKIELHDIGNNLVGSTEVQTNEINRKLSSGNYTIMHTEKTTQGYYILLGKIKK